MAKNNKFPQHLLLKLNRQILHKVNNKKTNKYDKKSGLHLSSKAQRSEKFPNLFKNTNIGISFKITTTLHHQIEPLASTWLQEHEKSGIYKITCKTCHKAHVGQASRN